MDYQAVNNRCAVDLNSLDTTLDDNWEILPILEEKGFRKIDVNIIALANSLVGKAKWKLASRQCEAPYYFDCSSFTKWIYAQRGISIPRRSIQQCHFCTANNMDGLQIRQHEVLPGDLLFVTSPYVNGKLTDKHEGVGHVGLVVDNNHAICATSSELGRGVIKITLDELFKTRRFCSAGRIIPRDSEVITLLAPLNREVETSDDIRWIVIQSLDKKN